MTTAQVVETSVTVNNGPIKDYVHPDDHTQPIYETTPGFKPITSFKYCNKEFLRCHYGDSNGIEKAKKSTRTRLKSNSLYEQHILLYLSLQSLHNYEVN